MRFLTWEPDLVGLLLQTGYERFSSPCGVHGLGKRSGLTLNLLAVSSDNPGTGQFRIFIAECKTRFDCISVWEIWNDDLRNALVRYGFKDVSRKEDNGETLIGMEWRGKTDLPIITDRDIAEIVENTVGTGPGEVL